MMPISNVSGSLTWINLTTLSFHLSSLIFPAPVTALRIMWWYAMVFILRAMLLENFVDPTNLSLSLRTPGTSEWSLSRAVKRNSQDLRPDMKWKVSMRQGWKVEMNIQEVNSIIGEWFKNVWLNFLRWLGNCLKNSLIHRDRLAGWLVRLLTNWRTAYRTDWLIRRLTLILASSWWVYGPTPHLAPLFKKIRLVHETSV